MEAEIPDDLKPLLFDGQLFYGKWGELVFVSKNRLSYADMPGTSMLTAVNDIIYGRYFLQDIEPAWQRDSILRNLCRYAQPWATDLSGLDTQQLTTELLNLFQQDKLRAWRLTDGWAKPPAHVSGTGFVPAGSPPKAGGSVAAAPSATTGKASKPKGGGASKAQPLAAKAAVHEPGVTVKSPQENGIPTEEEIALAKMEGHSNSHVQAREKISRHFLESNGFSESQIANAIGDSKANIDGGVDFTKPVEVIKFPPPDEMTQYVKAHGYPGNWFDPTSNQTPDALGLSGEGRRLTSFRLPPSTGLLSHSKPIVDNWTNPKNPVSTSGGGKQLLVNDETKMAVISLNKIGL